MSQVLYANKPIPPTTDSLASSRRRYSNHLPGSSSSSTSNSKGLTKKASTLSLPSLPSASSSSSSLTRPKRAAAVASQAATQAVTQTRRRKSSQSSSSNHQKSASQHRGSASDIVNDTTTSAAAPASQSSAPDVTNALQGQRPKQKSTLTERVMAPIPRAKRARKGAGPADDEAGQSNGTTAQTAVETVPVSNGAAAAYTNGGSGLNGHSSTTKSNILMGIDSALTNGYYHPPATNNAYPSGISASGSISSQGGRGGGNTIKELINGREEDVFVLDSTSPDVDLDASREMAARGKRKANASPSDALINGLPSLNSATAKRRRTYARPVAEKAPVVVPPVYRPKTKIDNIPAFGQSFATSGPGAAGLKTGLPSYRGGYSSDYGQQAASAAYIDNPYRLDRQDLPVDDSEGHYVIRNGTLIAGRYRIMGLLGQGTFGKVVRCKDEFVGREVAIKIIRSIQKYTDAAQIEIRVLKELRQQDPTNENNCIHLIDTFVFRGHVCIISELLGQSVFDFLKDNDFQPFPCTQIWPFAAQLLRSVAFLHRLGLIHTDLKPENILLVKSDFTMIPLTRRATSRKKKLLLNTDIRLIDFGSATFEDDYHSQVVSTRHYRAPEIILQMGWSFPCDAWSIGCILIEFYTGEALFQTHDNLEHLAMMEAVLGPMPDAYRRKAETYKPNYFRNGRLDFPNIGTSKQSIKFVKGMKSIDEVVNSGPEYAKHDQLFRHLLRRLLTFDPTTRIQVEQALRHPYFNLTREERPPAR